MRLYCRTVFWGYFDVFDSVSVVTEIQSENKQRFGSACFLVLVCSPSPNTANMSIQPVAILHCRNAPACDMLPPHKTTRVFTVVEPLAACPEQFVFPTFSSLPHKTRVVAAPSPPPSPPPAQAKLSPHSTALEAKRAHTPCFGRHPGVKFIHEWRKRSAHRTETTKTKTQSKS